MKASVGCFVLAVVAALLTACESYHYGKRFDPRADAPPETAETNEFVSVEFTNRLRPDWLQPSADFFTLGPGDQIEAEIIGDPATKATVVVGPDGKIYFHLLPGIKVSGLTLKQTKAQLEKELTAFIRGAPQVALALTKVESKRVWMLGRLNTPGVYNLSMPMTLLEALAAAGGPATTADSGSGSDNTSGTSSSASQVKELADLDHSFVLREGRLLPVNFRRLLREGDLSQNIYLGSGDFVYLPSLKAREVYVLGEVASPRPVSFTSRITLVSAIAGAGGTLKKGYLSHVAVVRGSLTQPTVAILNYQAMVKGKVPDVPLQPGDIVYVPLSPYDTLIRYTDLILNTFVRTVGANEGAAAAGAGPVGVNVPIGF